MFFKVYMLLSLISDMAQHYCLVLFHGKVVMICQPAVAFGKVVEEKLLFVELSGKVSQRKNLFMLHGEDDYQSSELVEVLQTTRKHAE